MELKLKYKQDPGHGWLEVPVHIFKRYHVTDKISRCSYYSHRSSKVFLEEDVDMPVFLNAVEAAGDSYRLTEEHCNGESRIRKMDSYSSTFIN